MAAPTMSGNNAFFAAYPGSRAHFVTQLPGL
jgi:hypothetical protein